MKVLKEILKSKLQTASFFLKSSIASTAVSGILLESSNRGIEIYSTDLSSFYHSYIPAKKENDFSIIIEPKKIIEVLNTLSQEEIEVIIKEKKLIIKAGKTKAEFPAIVAKEYPKPAGKKRELVSLPNEIFDSLPLVLFSAASDEARPILTGVNFVKKNEDLIMVATDGFRLSLVKTKTNIVFDEGDHVVPADFLKIILKEVKKDEEIKFYYDLEEKLVLFSIGEDEYLSRLIEGEFPPYEKVIPESFSTEVVLEKDEFLRNVKFASVFAKDYSNVVLFDIKKDGVYIYPKTETEGQETRAFQEIRSFEGEEQVVAFNFRFLIEFLNQASGEEIKIKIIKPEAPVVFEVVGKEGFVHIIMPVRINE